jgi:hypothetical protein
MLTYFSNQFFSLDQIWSENNTKNPQNYRKFATEILNLFIQISTRS